MLDNLVAIRSVVITAETGSFSETGRRLGVSHSVVSKRISQLEHALRRKLFTRSTRNVALTDFGELQLPKLQRIVREYEELMAGTTPHETKLAGQLSLKLPAYDVIASSLRELLADFIGLHPELSLNALFVDRVVNPAEEAFDISLTMMPYTFDGVEEFALCPFVRRMVAAPAFLERHGSPQTLEELAHLDCLVFTPMGQEWSLTGESGASTIIVNGHVRTNDSRLIYDLVRRGEGIAVLPAMRIDNDIAAGRLSAVLPEFALPDVWLKAMVPRQRLAAPAVQAMLRFLKEKGDQITRTIQS